MIYVQHLLGVGHLQRARMLAAALAGRGLGVDLVSGGMPQSLPAIEGVDCHQLPPARSPDATFTRLVGADGETLDDAWRLTRRRNLLELFDRLAPRALVTETFPFGRRMLRFELLPLLEAARRSHHCRLVVASIRDILQPKKAARNRETCAQIERYYDRVLVHADPAIARLEDSFAAVDPIRDKLHYSGYIASQETTPEGGADNPGEVLVSAGGSATGAEILACAIAARPLTSLADRCWRIRVSPAIDNPTFEDLRRKAGKGILVERNRDDFAARIRRASLSISQAGYNTVCDLLASSVPAVIVPFAAAGEAEQTLRATRLQECHRAIMLAEGELTPENLAAAVERALRLDTRLDVDLDGAADSAAAIESWLADTDR